jgi:cytochrome c-type biogenesis protein CcmH/NrfG
VNNLAGVLATSQDPAVRNPEEAVRLAEQACQGTRFSQPGFLYTLAGAYAEAGRFDAAVRTLQQLVPVAAADPNKAVLEDLERRIKRYQEHRTVGP